MTTTKTMTEKAIVANQENARRSTRLRKSLYVVHHEIPERRTVAELSQSQPPKRIRAVLRAKGEVNLDTDLGPPGSDTSESKFITGGELEQSPLRSPIQLFEELSAAEREASRFDLEVAKTALAKGYSRPDSRLLLIEWCLKGNGIGEPEDILGVQRLRILNKRILRGLSNCDFRRADQVQIWLPYFYKLLSDVHSHGEREVLKMGYREDAVLSCRSKRSAVEAACDWLACRPGFEGVDAPSLRNTYSKIYGPRRRRKSNSMPPGPHPDTLDGNVS